MTRGWNSLEKHSALTEGGYCSREVLHCETSLCEVVGVGVVTKIDKEENSHPFATASRGRTSSGGGQLHMKPSFASDQLCVEKSFHLSS